MSGHEVRLSSLFSSLSFRIPETGSCAFGEVRAHIAIFVICHPSPTSHTTGIDASLHPPACDTVCRADEEDELPTHQLEISRGPWTWTISDFLERHRACDDG